jgi:hypothetical protein
MSRQPRPNCVKGAHWKHWHNFQETISIDYGTLKINVSLSEQYNCLGQPVVFTTCLAFLWMDDSKPLHLKSFEFTFIPVSYACTSLLWDAQMTANSRTPPPPKKKRWSTILRKPKYLYGYQFSNIFFTSGRDETADTRAPNFHHTEKSVKFYTGTAMNTLQSRCTVSRQSARRSAAAGESNNGCFSKAPYNYIYMSNVMLSITATYLV